MKSFPVTVSRPIQWGDMDALGLVNNARYLTWFESARIALLSWAGVLADRPREMGPILATTTCDFVRPLTFPAMSSSEPASA
jgi:acyl-CoA thioester hydrolase